MGQVAVVADGAAQRREHQNDKYDSEQQLVPIGGSFAVTEYEG